MYKSRTEIKCTVKGYPLDGLAKAVNVVKCVFLISIQLLPINLNIS